MAGKSSIAAPADYIDWKEWDNAKFGVCSAMEARQFAAELDIQQPRSSRVLEIGFGNGATLGWLKSIGADAYGVETNPDLVVRARRMLGEEHVFHELADEHLTRLAGTFTHVLAFDVVEHVPLELLVPMLARIRELLEPEGVCVLRFPNGDSPFGRVNQHGDPTHVTTIGHARIEYLARRAGLSVAAVRAPALPLSGVGVRRALRRACILAGRAIVERLISVLYFGGRRIPMDPNYIAVLRRPR